MSCIKLYYHGSITPGITTLEPRSRLHTTGQSVIYLTDSIPYALFYLWDAQHNRCDVKHVTGWLQQGAAWYEEQFANQLQTFYQGVTGCLYTVADHPAIRPVEGRESLYYAAEPLAIAGTEHIPDVYAALLDCEKQGTLHVRRYLDQPPARQQELIDLIAQALLKADFYADQPQQQAFMRRHFHLAWAKAEQLRT